MGRRLPACGCFAMRSIGLWRTVVRRSRADLAFLIAVWLLLVSAITLIAAGTLYTDTVEVGGLRQSVQSVPPADQAIAVRLAAAADEVDSLDATVAPLVRNALGAVGGSVALSARSGSLKPVGPASADDGQRLSVVASLQDIGSHATIVTGRWAELGRSPVEATLSEGAAAALGLAVGGTAALADASSPGADPTVAVTTVIITGIWRPDPLDAYWLGDPLETTGILTTATTTYRGPYVIAREDLLAGPTLTRLDLQWRGILALDRLRVDRLDSVRNGIATLPAQLTRDMPDDRFVSVTGKLAAVLTNVDRAVLVSRTGVIILTLQFAVLAGYAVLLVGGMLVERRRAEVGLLRSRGASGAHIAALAVGEALVLCVPAVIVAPMLAIGVIRLIGSLGPLSDTGLVASVGVSDSTIFFTILAGIGGVLALAVPALGASADLARIRAALGRPMAQTLGQRLGIDLVLLILAGIGLWQLRLYGAPLTRDARGTLGLDPLLVAAPAFSLAAGAVLATRFVPRLAEIGERVLGRRRGLVPPLGARQLARRPLRYTRSALLLLLAAALGTFAAIYASTWTQSQADQAAYRSASDIRFVAGDYPDVPSWAVGPALRAIDGVEAAVPVVRQTLDVGRVVRGGVLVAVDPAAVRPVLRLAPEAVDTQLGAGLDALGAGRPAPTGLEIANQPMRLSLRLTTRIAARNVFLDTSVPPDFRGVRVAVVAADADHRLHRFPSAVDAAGMFSAPDQRIEISLVENVGDQALVAPAPLTIVALEFTVLPPSVTVAIGSITLLGIDASPSSDGEAWTPVAFDPSAAPWRWSQSAGDGVPFSSTGPSFTFGANDRGVQGAGLEQVPNATFQLSAVPDANEISAIASTRFLELTGATVGDRISATSRFVDLSVHIAGATSAFPPMDPALPYLVVDSPTMDLIRFRERGEIIAADDWWIRTRDDAAASAAAVALAAEPFMAREIVVRSTLTRALERDPVALGVVGALGLGALAAMAFAIIGFLVGAVVSTRERLGEFALLQALGMARRQLTGWLAMESIFLLALGLVAGCSLGLLMAWLVLPFATLNAQGSVVVPPPTIIVPWQAIALVVGAAIGLLIATVVTVGRQVGALPITTVLRSRDE